MSDETPELADLTERERRFVEAYAGDAAGNGARAAELAGYAGDVYTRSTQAWRLLKKAEVREVLNAMLESDPLVMGRVERLRRLSAIGRGEYTETKFNAEGEPYEVNPPAKDVIAACKELGLLAGDYVTKVAQTNGAGEDLATMPLEQVFALAGLVKV